MYPPKAVEPKTVTGGRADPEPLHNETDDDTRPPIPGQVDQANVSAVYGTGRDDATAYLVHIWRS